jgi:hypothetical protein
VGDGAADSTGKGESGVKLEPRELGSSRCSRSFHLGSNRSAGGHYDGICVLHTGEKDEEKKIKRDGGREESGDVRARGNGRALQSGMGRN